jgi:hypothetical protein
LYIGFPIRGQPNISDVKLLLQFFLFCEKGLLFLNSNFRAATKKSILRFIFYIHK